MAKKINLRNLERRMRRLGQMGTFTLLAAIRLRGEMIKRWDRSMGGNDQVLKPTELSPGYAKRKAASGRTPVPNMQFTGAMKRGLTAKAAGKDKAVLTFRGGEMNKARGNFETRPNFMMVGKGITSIINKFILKKIKS